jgi:dihydropyrimidinase/allantoinase
MRHADLVVRNAQVYTAEGSFEGGIAIIGEKIVAVGDNGSLPPAHEVVDAAGKALLPGLIDAHVHVRAPGRADREDFVSGTQAAAAGGITTILEMPVSQPGVANAEILLRRAEIASRDAVVDFGLYGGGGASNVADIAGMAAAGAVAFKTFMHGPPKGRESEYEGLHVLDDGALYDVFAAVAKTGRLACVHAENNSLVERGIAAMRAAGRTDPPAHGPSRPPLAEIEAASRVILLARDAGARVSICHISLPETALMARRARFGGQQVMVESCPHYLLLTEQMMDEVGPFAKINPPLRAEQHRSGLWRCLEEGWLDYLASDHAPFVEADKLGSPGDIFAAPAGAPGIETMVPVLADEMLRSSPQGLSLLVRCLALNPARIFGLYPQKGALLPGSDGDFVLLDTEQPRVISRDRMYTKSRGSARLYDGWEVTGWPVMTAVRGRIVMREGQVIGERGFGKMVRPAKGD